MRRLAGCAVICAKGYNIGDDIQTLAVINHIPNFKYFVMRDNMNDVFDRNLKKLTQLELSQILIPTVVSGWFLHDSQFVESQIEDKQYLVFPPPEHIMPLFLSIHLSTKYDNFLYNSNNIEYFKKHEPIGCRDEYTFTELTAKGVKAYISGCMTLTLNRNVFNFEDYILQNKTTASAKLYSCSKTVNQKVYYAVRCMSKIEDPVSDYELINHLDHELLVMDPVARLFKALDLLYKYARAEEVITDRLHCYLPCRAFKTPVKFVGNKDDIRMIGLIELDESKKNEYVKLLTEKLSVFKNRYYK